MWLILFRVIYHGKYLVEAAETPPLVLHGGVCPTVTPKVPSV
jgi:hypothetical protein